MVAKKKKPVKAKKLQVNEGAALQTELQTLLGLISYGIPYYFVTADTLEKQRDMLSAAKGKWSELAQELSSIRAYQHDCTGEQIWCASKGRCTLPDNCDDEGGP